MGFLLAHLPAHLHMVISTRSDPDLPLSRWRRSLPWSAVRETMKAPPVS